MSMSKNKILGTTEINMVHNILISSKLYRENSAFDFKVKGANEAHLQMLLRIFKE